VGISSRRNRPGYYHGGSRGPWQCHRLWLNTAFFPPRTTMSMSSVFHSLPRLLAVALLSLLGACAWFGGGDDVPTDDGERQIYDTAQRYLRSANYELAVKNLQLLEARYPFGPYAEQAQLELIYAYYRNYDTEAAVAAADRFIRLHPQHPGVDYAYYMKGLASYTEGKGMLERFLPTDMSHRDPGPARDSFNDFAQLLARYPDSKYAPDARARMVHLRNLLARYEINVANYYFKRGAYVAALNRGRYVVENFPQSTAVPDGLAVMVQGYQLLNLPELADSSLRTLRENYPEHPSLDQNGRFIPRYGKGAVAGKTWLNRLSFGLLDRSDPSGFDSRAIYGAE